MQTKESSNDNFESELKVVLKILNEAQNDYQKICQAIESNLNEQRFEEMLIIVRELTPKTINNLQAVFNFIHKYGYNDTVAKIKTDISSEKNQSRQD